MKILTAVMGLSVVWGIFACNKSKLDSAISSSPSDGRAQIEFLNKCTYDVVLGRMMQGDFATIKPGDKYQLDLGPDTQVYSALAYYGYQPGMNPGLGNFTLAEFTFNSFKSVDFYDVSNVDAFNIGMKINNQSESCQAALCAGDVLNTCPEAQKIVKDGHVISCSKKGDRDNPNNPAAQHFKKMCKHSYTWSGEGSATVGCDSQDYTVTFCPAS